MAQAYFLENEDGEKIYPVSHADATFNRHGQLIGNVLDEIGNNTAENLICFPYYGVHQENGIEWTDLSDGRIMANGTATANSVFSLNPRLQALFDGSEMFLPKGKYTVSDGLGTGTSYTYSVQVNAYTDGNDESSAQIFCCGSGTNQPHTYEVTEDNKLVWAYIVIRSGVTVENLIFEPMLVRGTEQRDYVPYRLSRQGLREDINTLATKVNTLVPDNTDTDANTDNVSISIGECETDGTVSEKVVTISSNDNWELVVGSIIAVKFTNTNTASNVTLNVNNTGAKSIWYNNAVFTSNSNIVNGAANRFTLYMYDGTYWVWLTNGVDANTRYTNALLGQGYGTCATAETTAAKSVILSGYTLVVGGIIAVKFTYNVPANSTMNINSRGAKAIFYRNAAITANVIRAGDIATFIYDGTQYHLLTVDRDSIPSHYGTCSTAAATVAKTVDCEGFTLVTGAAIKVTFTVTNTANNPTLNVNGTGAKAIMYRNRAINAAHLAANRTYEFVYDGTYYQVVGDLDANTFDRLRYNGAIMCSETAIAAGNLIVGRDGLYQHLKLGQAFDISYPILYAGVAIGAGATGTNNYKAIHMTITQTQTITLTTHLPVYIKGTLKGNIFTPVSTTPITQEVPTSEDDYQYILLGLASSTTTFYLLTENPVYEYRDEAFEMYTPTRSANLISNEDDLMLNSVEGYSVDATLIKAINSKINGIEFQITNGRLQYRFDQEVWG